MARSKAALSLWVLWTKPGAHVGTSTESPVAKAPRATSRARMVAMIGSTNAPPPRRGCLSMRS